MIIDKKRVCEDCGKEFPWPENLTKQDRSRWSRHLNGCEPRQSRLKQEADARDYENKLHIRRAFIEELLPYFGKQQIQALGQVMDNMGLFDEAYERKSLYR